VSCDPLDGAPLGLGAPPALRANQVLELDHHRAVMILPPHKLPVALIKGLEPASPELSAPDRMQQPLVVRGQLQERLVGKVLTSLLDVVHLGYGHIARVT
jgi:hypothetical protein